MCVLAPHTQLPLLPRLTIVSVLHCVTNLLRAGDGWVTGDTVAVGMLLAVGPNQGALG